MVNIYTYVWCHSGCKHDKDVGISCGKRMHLFVCVIPDVNMIKT